MQLVLSLCPGADAFGHAFREDQLDWRRERQRHRLAILGECGPRYRPWALRVEYYDQRLMGGWQAFLSQVDDEIWICRDSKLLIEPLMRLFPLVLPGFFGWYEWKEKFAVRFQRGVFCGRPRGHAIVRWDGKHELRAIEAAPITEEEL